MNQLINSSLENYDGVKPIIITQKSKVKKLNLNVDLLPNKSPYMINNTNNAKVHKVTRFIPCRPKTLLDYTYIN